MKKKIVFVLLVVLMICVGCSETHQHKFDVKSTDEKYLSTNATCLSPAKYYYSCACGEKSSDTFESGSALGHSMKEEWSYDEEYHWHQCSRCDEKSNYVHHTFDKIEIIKEATVSEDGLRAVTCSTCGYKKTEVITALGHVHEYNIKNVDDKFLASASTCISPSLFYYSCKCGDKGTTTFTVGSPLGHSFTDYSSNNDATCTKDGTKSAKCDHCNETSTIIDYGTKLAHTFDKKVIDDKFLASEGDCTHPKAYYYSCACGEKGTETFIVVDASGHSYTVFTSNNDATCTADGTKSAKCDHCDETITVIDEGSKLKHTFNKKVIDDIYKLSDATCNNPAEYYYSCECGEKGTTTFTVGSSLGHSFTDYSSNNDATCTKDGTKSAKCDHCEETITVIDYGTKLAHTFDKKVATDDHLAHEATCTHSSEYYYSCECGENGHTTFNSGNPLGHSFVNYVSDNNATCTTDGTKSAKCEHCMETDTIIDYGTILDHIYNKKVIDEIYKHSDATCNDPASYYYSCECGAKGEETFTVGSPLGHSFINYVSNNDATCTSDGTKTAKCEHCGETLTVMDEGSKKEHSFVLKLISDEFIARKADCTHPVEYYYSCECGEKGEETFTIGSPLGHSFINFISNNDATCTSDGTKTAKCEHCSETSTIIDVGSKKEHTFDKKEVENKYLAFNADCTNPASYYYSCECGAKGTNTFEVGEALGHSYTIEVYNNDATCDHDGTKTLTCDRCGDEKIVSVEGTKLDHTYSTDYTSDETYHWHSSSCMHTGIQSEKALHNWVDLQIVREATEELSGLLLQECSVCGRLRLIEIEYSHVHTFSSEWSCDETYHWHSATCTHTDLRKDQEEHIWDGGVENREATHTQTGIILYTCECGYTLEIETPKLPTHTYSKWEYNNENNHKKTCECGDVLYEAHNFDKFVITREATHTLEGIITYTCSECGGTKEEIIPKIEGHSFNDWSEYNDLVHSRSCGCGEIEYEEHDFDKFVITREATHILEGVKTYTCSKCGATKEEIIPKIIEHSFGDWTNFNETYHKHVCECGEIEYEEHIWDDGVITKYPSHLEYGIKTYTCEKCGKTRTEQIEKIAQHNFGDWTDYNETQHKHICECGEIEYEEHEWDDGVVTSEPTHKLTGIKTYTCEKCGKTKTIVLDKVPHNFGDWEELDENNHKHTCSCGEVELETHTWDEGVITKQPTHTEFGIKTYTCTKCNATKTEDIARLTLHSYGIWEYFDEDNHKHSCICGEYELEEHNYVYDYETDSSITLHGYKYYKCTGCEHYIQEEKPLIPSVKVRLYDGSILLDEFLVEKGTIPTIDDPIKEGYRFDKWDKEIETINEDTDYYATFVKVWNIEYYFNGELVKTDVVDEGTIPSYDNPTLDGYRFDKWDKNFVKTYKDESYFATFIQIFKVTLIVDGNIYAIEYVDKNGSIESDDPEKDGFKFVDWDNSEVYEVTQDLEANAIFDQFWNVDFVNYNEKIISSQIIRPGEKVTLPDNPSRENNQYFAYEFVGWYVGDVEFDPEEQIESDLVIKATYNTIRCYNITFIYGDNIIKSIQVYEEDSINEEDIPSFDESKKIGYRFDGWYVGDVEFNPEEQIESDLIINARYVRVYKVTFIDGLTYEAYSNTVDFNNPMEVDEGTTFEEILNKISIDEIIMKPHYTFVKWDYEFDTIQNDENVYGIYEQKGYKVTFADEKRGSSTTLIAHFGDTVYGPELDNYYYFDNIGLVKEYNGWSLPSLTIDDESLIGYDENEGIKVNANYIEKLTIRIEKMTDSPKSIKVVLASNDDSLYMYALSLKLSWDEKDTRYDVYEEYDENTNSLKTGISYIHTDFLQTSNYSNKFKEITYSCAIEKGYNLKNTTGIIAITFDTLTVDESINLNNLNLSIEELTIKCANSENSDELFEIKPYIVIGGIIYEEN